MTESESRERESACEYFGFYGGAAEDQSLKSINILENKCYRSMKV